MYWDDFAALIRRNLAPCAIPRFYPPSLHQPNMVTICDFSRRRISQRIVGENALVGAQLDLHEQELARVCNAGWSEGQLPFKSDSGRVETSALTGEEKVIMPMRGAKDTLVQLLKGNVIKPTIEIAQYVDEPEKHAPRVRWYVC